MIEATLRVVVSVACLSLCAAAAAPSQPSPAAADELPVLTVGETAQSALEDDAPVVTTQALVAGGYASEHAVVGRTWRVEVDASGPYHIDVQSWFFDAYLVLLDADGTVLAEDDDGFGIGVHSRVVVDLEAGRDYRVQACALHGQRGKYELSLRSGPAPARTPRDLGVARLHDARRRAEATEARYGPQAAETATSLRNLGALLQSQGDLSAARPLIERAVAIRGAVLGPEHMSTAIALNDLGLLLQSQGDLSGARPPLERALSISESARGLEHPHTATLLTNLAVLLQAQGDLTGARPLFERALAIYESVRGPEHPVTASSLNSLAVVLQYQDDPSGARPLHERALAIREAVLGPEHPDTAQSLSNLGKLLQIQGDLSGARPLLERALAIREAVLGPEHPITANSLNDLGLLLLNQGDLSGARPLLERALAMQTSVLGPEHLETARSLNNLGLLLQDQGDLSGARPLLERALAIRESVLGPEHPDTAKALNNLGLLLRSQGDLSAARPLLERALAIRESVLGPEHPNTASSLSSLGALLRSQGDLSGARPVFERALAIYESVRGPEHRDTAAALNNLAELLKAQGDLSAARPLYARALAIWESELDPEHPDTASALDNLGSLLQDQGDLSGARPLLEGALAIRKAVLGPEHPSTANSLHNLAALLFVLDEGEAAWKLVVDAAEGRRTSVMRIIATLTEGEALLYLAQSRWHVDFMLTLAAHREDAGASALAYEVLLDWKGRVGRAAIAGRERLLRDVSSQERAWLDRLRDLQALLARSVLSGDDRDLPDIDPVALREERADLERRLRRAAEVSDAEQAVSVARLSAALPAGSALVDLFAHRDREFARWEDGASVVAAGWTAPRLSAWITRPDRQGVVHVDLGPVAEIEPAIGNFLEELVMRRGVAVAGEPAGPDRGAVLRERLWDPLAAHLDGVTTVFVSPDGVAGTLPLEVLREADGRYLIEDRAFVYVADAVSLVERLEADVPDAGADAIDSLLSVGGVDFRRRVEEDPALLSSDTSTLRGSFSSYWGRLPATEYESQVVSDMHEDAFLDRGRRVLLQGAEATESRLKSEMPRHAVLHIATHGFFQPEGLPSMWDAAREAADASGGPQLSEAGERLVGMHPGLLSGLVLAGVNRPATDDVSGDDGYLTAEELTWLDLSGVELVVLSACETGLGRAASGEGLMGLRRALRIAGADSVISSLWSVKDESTSELMQSFYANLFFEGMGRHEALRAAQLEMLRDNRAREGRGLPSTWGAFVLSGEWR